MQKNEKAPTTTELADVKLLRKSLKFQANEEKPAKSMPLNEGKVVNEKLYLKPNVLKNLKSALETLNVDQSQ